MEFVGFIYVKVPRGALSRLARRQLWALEKSMDVLVIGV